MTDADICLDNVVGTNAEFPAPGGDEGVAVVVSGGAPGQVQLTYWPDVESIVVAMPIQMRAVLADPEYVDQLTDQGWQEVAAAVARLVTEAVAVETEVRVDFEHGLLVALPSLLDETLGDWTNRVGAAAIQALVSGGPKAVVERLGR